MKSAYDLINENIAGVEGNWKALLMWKGLHRIQTFMWLVAHDCILTNYRRSKWGAGISPVCPCCGNDDETVLHVLRDCSFAAHVWSRLVPQELVTYFSLLTA
jgi:hypothetical protein